MKEGSEIKLVRPSGGRGMAFGTVVHRLIEVVGQGKTFDQVTSYVKTIAEEKKLDAKGIIDFLFEEEDGWVLVDFKTDSYDDEHEQN